MKKKKEILLPVIGYRTIRPKKTYRKASLSEPVIFYMLTVLVGFAAMGWLSENF